MSKIVYYPDCLELFQIKTQGGICYYLIDKEIHKYVKITNKCKKNKLLNSEDNREIGNSLFNCSSIFDKIGKPGMQAISNDSGVYGVYTLKAYMNGALMLNSGNTLLFGEMYTCKTKYGPSGQQDVCIFTQDSEERCNSFISYMQTKFIRFIAFTRIDGQQPKFKEIYKYIPDPGAFDHIFTDEELYKKYNLTPEEISLIESVIKERQ